MRRVTSWIKSWNRFDIAYLVLLAGMLGVELAGVRRKAQNDTLSEATRWALGIGDRRNPYVWVSRGLLVGFLFWFSGHLATRKL